MTRRFEYTPVSHRSGIRLQRVIAWKIVPRCRKRLVNVASPLLLHVGSCSSQRAPAVAVIAGVTALTLICFGFASSRFGMLRVNTPFL